MDKEGKMLAEQHGFYFIETSAFANDGVTDAFETLMNSVYEAR